MISSRAQYTIRALSYLASQNPGQLTPSNRLAKVLGISPSFLAKILTLLVEADLVFGLRGPTGGYRLTKPASEVSLRDIVVAVDGPGIFTDCVLGLPGCGEEAPCPVHDEWTALRTQMSERFSRRSLADLAAGYREHGQRLSAEA